MKNTVFLIGFALWYCQSNPVTNPEASDKTGEPSREVITRYGDSGLNKKTSVIPVDSLSADACKKHC